MLTSKQYDLLRFQPLPTVSHPSESLSKLASPGKELRDIGIWRAEPISFRSSVRLALPFQINGVSVAMHSPNISLLFDYFIVWICINQTQSKKCVYSQFWTLNNAFYIVLNKITVCPLLNAVHSPSLTGCISIHLL